MKKFILKFLACIPFFIIWVIYIFVLFVFHDIGWFDGFEYVYGKYVYVLLGVMCVVAFASVIYLRFFINREFKIQMIAIIMTLISGIIIYGMLVYNDVEFSAFSTEKFINYPNWRLNMYDDLVQKYNLEGYTYSQVEALLGKPDKSGDTGYVYFDDFYNRISLKFKSGKVVEISYSE